MHEAEDPALIEVMAGQARSGGGRDLVEEPQHGLCYAPSHGQSELGGEQLRVARTALDRLLAGHEPYPAVVLDRWGDIVLANRAIGPLLEGVEPALLTPPVNVYRLSLHPQGLAPRIGTAGRGPRTSATG